jgi:HSP20 family protein
MKTMYKDPIKEMLDTFFETKSFYNRNTKQTDVIYNDDNYLIYLAVPGLSKDDIKIGIKDSFLTISYEKEKMDESNYSFINSFKKTYSLPDDVDEKNITGKVENGVVELTIPKTKKKSIERFISLN